MLYQSKRACELRHIQVHSVYDCQISARDSKVVRKRPSGPGHVLAQVGTLDMLFAPHYELQSHENGFSRIITTRLLVYLMSTQTWSMNHRRVPR